MNTKKHRGGFDDQTYECTTCDYKCGSKQLIDQHNATKKHMNAVNGIQKPVYKCLECNLITNYKSMYDIHMNTKKHKKQLNLHPAEIHDTQSKF